MGPFLAEGKQALVEDLLGQWASQIHEFGFANHNFYWEGKEPGLWSDDALWLFQAIERYVTLTGSTAILDREFAVAGGSGARRRLYDTLKAVLRYSGRISVGRHGLPLLDRADWNDCLKVDRTFPDGTQKQDLWTRRQEADPGASERSLDTDGTESVMNAFLLKRAADILAGLARTRKDGAGASWAEAIGRDMVAACRHHAWKGSWYARLLVNRPSSYPVVGAPGDGLSTDETDGSLFLNSFSWAVLAGVAGDAEIAAMYPLLESRLKTPHGYRLVTAHDLRRVEPTVASAEYFPGDRENGAVFKHASPMAVAALLKGASEVKDPVLARNLAASAWSMIDLAAPGRTLSDPFVLAGNPRFCTQYNNSETGENIGPLLSGTASWASLALRQAFGVDLRTDVLVLDPILRESQSSAEVEVRWQDEFYRIRYTKPEGFVRAKDQQPEVRVDGRPLDGLVIPRLGGPGTRDIEVRWS
jgi:cellobiose phosphorylase